MLHSALKARRWKPCRAWRAGKRRWLLKRWDCIFPEEQLLCSLRCWCWLCLQRLRVVRRLCFAHRRIKKEGCILLFFLLHRWQGWAGYSRQAACRLLLQWLTERKVCRRFTRYLVRETSMWRLRNSWSVCVMWRLICLPVHRKWKCWRMKRQIRYL